jgi:hypothetical protein
MTSLAARILTHYYCERLAAKLPLNLEKVQNIFQNFIFKDNYDFFPLKW